MCKISQGLGFHPHIHCIVSGGGINKAGQWVKEKRANGNYLFPKPVIEKEYRLYFLQKLQTLLLQQKIKTTDVTAVKSTIEKLSKIRWNVHANAPLGGPAQILEYLGRYTHKTAITAHRIKEITGTTITFTYKDYADGKKQKLMVLSHEEFARRFEQHILPKRFVKIRHGGKRYRRLLEHFKTWLHRYLSLYEKERLHRYCVEFAYRYNNKQLTGREKFDIALTNVSTARITYNALIGK